MTIIPAEIPAEEDTQYLMIRLSAMVPLMRNLRPGPQTGGTAASDGSGFE